MVLGLMQASVFAAYRPAYLEVTEPSIDVALQGMRGHQLQWNNYMLYTMNVENPGFIEIGGYNYSKDGEIGMRPFYRWRPGPVVETHRELDLYLDAEGKGMYIVKLGDIYAFTKDGRMKKDSTGRLVTLSGEYPVMGEEGEIILPDGEISISTSGLIFVAGQPVSRLKVILFESFDEMQKLETLNGSFWVLEDEIKTVEGFEHYKIRQGMLEQSNVLKALVGDMKFVINGYENSVRSIKSIAKMMNSSTQLGSP